MSNEQAAAASQDAAPRLLYVVTEDWAFLSHRLPMARAARDAGFEVHVATRVSSGAAAIEAERFVLHPIPFARGSLSPITTLSTIAALRRLHRELKPALTHHVALQACALGMLAKLGQPAACVNAFIGLGYLFTSGSGKARVVRSLVGLLLRFLVNRNNSIALVQNPDDMAALLSLGIAKSRIALIAGTPDPANPASVTESEARSWNDQPGIAWLGHVGDIAGFWAKVHVAVLPSRREGLPLSLMEAAACGRALIASDAPGCREVVLHEQTGLLFPVDHAPALAEAMVRLAADVELRTQCAVAARNRVVQKFAADIIGRQTVALYERVLEESSLRKSRAQLG